MENIVSVIESRVQNICGIIENSQFVLVRGRPFLIHDEIRINADTINLLEAEQDEFLWTANIIKSYKKYLRKESTLKKIKS